MQIPKRLQPLAATHSRLGRWHPPSWQLGRVAQGTPEALRAELEQLTATAPAGHYWVLQQGRMNATSLRQSLLSLNDSHALLAALDAHFREGKESAVVRLLPGRQAAGILFTRHPLRQDLDHLVVEGICDESQPAQRLILQVDGRVVFRSQPEAPLDESVPSGELLALANALKTECDRPQAAEWVYDGRQLWLLQTLPIGSLPNPVEAWSCRVDDGFWPQVVTPLWYTLESRWLKNRFWEPLVAQSGWRTLHKVEPYRRQHSHIYRNSQFFQRLPGFTDALPPAWRETQMRQPAPILKPLGWPMRWWLGRQVALTQKRLAICLAKLDGHWQRLLELDLLGAELAVITGNLHYRRPQTPATLPAGVRAWLDGRSARLRAGLDPIHAFMQEVPPESNSLPLPDARLAGLLSVPPAKGWAHLRTTADDLREQLADAMRDALLGLGAELVAKGFLSHPEDVHFCYFDELWQLCEKRTLPASLSAEVLGKRKLRYLEDAHTGAPDWKLDQLGFGFNQDHQAHDLLLGNTVVPGQAQGRVRRLVSSWVLNQVSAGDVLVMHQCDPHWLPWLSQAAGLILATRNPQDPAIELARVLGIPCIHALDDAMHCLADGQQVQLDADTGQVLLLSD